MTKTNRSRPDNRRDNLARHMASVPLAVSARALKRIREQPRSVLTTAPGA